MIESHAWRVEPAPEPPMSEPPAERHPQAVQILRPYVRNPSVTERETSQKYS
jgi:hypothetical protein